MRVYALHLQHLLPSTNNRASVSQYSIMAIERESFKEQAGVATSGEEIGLKIGVSVFVCESVIVIVITLCNENGDDYEAT